MGVSRRDQHWLSKKDNDAHPADLSPSGTPEAVQKAKGVWHPSRYLLPGGDLGARGFKVYEDEGGDLAHLEEGLELECDRSEKLRCSRQEKDGGGADHAEEEAEKQGKEADGESEAVGGHLVTGNGEEEKEAKGGDRE